MADKVLIVDDDPSICRLLEKVMHSNELETTVADSGLAALNLLKNHSYDMILMDITLGDMEGFDVIKKLRSQGIQTPVMIISGRNEDYDSLYGLSLGADDYITKPFSLMVLRARVNVQLRDIRQEADIFKDGDFYFDFYKMEFLYKGSPVCLSRTEQRLLRCLIENRGKNVSRNYLIDEIWQGESEFVEEHALTVAVNRLRKKLGIDKNHPDYIKTVYGVGYIW